MNHAARPPPDRRDPGRKHAPADDDRRRRHDAALKHFFSHHLAVESLVRVMARGWHQHLDLPSITPFPTEHVERDLGRRLSDAAWRVSFRNRSRSVVFHVEFQSAIDPLMAFRSLEYISKAYLHMARNRDWRDPGGKIPPVLSFVLYNGAAPWRDAVSVAEMAPPPLAEAAEMQTVHRCGMLDMRSPSARDFPLDDLIVEWLAALERDFWGNVARVVDGLAERYGKPADAPLRNCFAVWSDEALRAAGTNKTLRQRIVDEINCPKKGNAMFSQIVEATEEIRQQGRAEGRAEGRVEGRTEGRTEGRMELVVRLAAKKFGPDAADQLQDILKSSPPTEANIVADMLLDCRTREEFLASVSKDGAA